MRIKPQSEQKKERARVTSIVSFDWSLNSVDLEKPLQNHGPVSDSEA